MRTMRVQRVNGNCKVFAGTRRDRKQYKPKRFYRPSGRLRSVQYRYRFSITVYDESPTLITRIRVEEISDFRLIHGRYAKKT